MGQDLAKLKLEFLASLNHQIRTPLSGILGMADLLHETPLNEDQERYVGAVRECANELFTLLNATLEYTTLASGSVRLAEADFAAAEPLQLAAAECRIAAERKGLRFRSNLYPSLQRLAQGDPLRIRQIAALLLSNAVKFTSEGDVELVGRLTGTPGAPVLDFTVRDTGVGMAPEILQQSLHGGRMEPGHAGFGLGLALVNRLLGLMGGQIEAESESGKGSRFTVRIPLAPPAAPEMPGVPEVWDHPARLLLVEDNHIAQQVISYNLRKANLICECAQDGLAALAAVHQKRFDLILMDLQMPGIDGLETTRRIRALPGWQDTPVIALTADSADDVRETCLAAGMSGFLTKPVQAQELLDTIYRALAQVCPAA